MKTKTIMKILTIVMVIAMIVTMSTVAFADIAIPTANGNVPTGMNNAAGQIITIVQFVCYAAAVIMLMVLGCLLPSLKVVAISQAPSPSLGFPS